MKVYVAGASAEATKIAGYMAALRAAGIKITHDWTKAVLEARARGWTDDLLDFSARRRLAEEDRAGVLAATWLWLVVPEGTASLGCWVELGIAVGSRTPVIVSGDSRRSIFTELAATFRTHEDAIRFLVDEARG